MNLTPDQVHYLSFGGGGGKGAAYLGALAAFAEEDIGILVPTNYGRKKDYELNRKQINGISGSSAGAITATLLASGWTLRELFEFTKAKEVLGNFYDEPDPRRRPLVVPDPRQRPRVVPDPIGGIGGSCETLHMPENIPVHDLFRPSFPEILTYSVNPIAQLKILLYLLTKTDKFNEMVLFLLLKRYLPEDAPEVMVKKIKDKPLLYFKNLLFDFGLFSGCYARSYFNKAIASRMGGRREATFKDFVDHFVTKLVLTGTDLIKMKSQYFSEETPDFKVVDALRISMSFPYAFKPVVIEAKVYPGGKYSGVWIDGGLLNNNPIHAFDTKPDGTLEKGMLGIRLGEDKANPINDFIEFTTALGNTILSPSELGQMRTPQEKAQTIILPTEGLSTLDFTPPIRDLFKSMLRSAESVRKYFGGKGPGKVVYEFVPVTTTLEEPRRTVGGRRY